jgi:predicted AAA+ superfamily ATPase
VIGVRRSGKSTLCHKVLLERGVRYGYVNFDDDRLADMKTEDLNTVLSCVYQLYGTDVPYLVLDEIQDVDGWYLFVNRLLRTTLHIFVTGSNAKLLSGELATHLTGRNKEIALYPFSFQEFCEMKGVDAKSVATKATAFRRTAFDEYMQQGGFPELMIIEDKRHYVNTLVDNILKRDIEQRYKIVFKAAFEQMAHHLLNISPSIVVAKELTDLFQFK